MPHKTALMYSTVVTIAQMHNHLLDNPQGFMPFSASHGCELQGHSSHVAPDLVLMEVKGSFAIAFHGSRTDQQTLHIFIAIFHVSISKMCDWVILCSNSHQNKYFKLFLCTSTYIAKQRVGHKLLLNFLWPSQKDYFSTQQPTLQRKLLSMETYCKRMKGKPNILFLLCWPKKNLYQI